MWPHLHASAGHIQKRVACTTRLNGPSLCIYSILILLLTVRSRPGCIFLYIIGIQLALAVFPVAVEIFKQAAQRPHSNVLLVRPQDEFTGMFGSMVFYIRISLSNGHNTGNESQAEPKNPFKHDIHLFCLIVGRRRAGGRIIRCYMRTCNSLVRSGIVIFFMAPAVDKIKRCLLNSIES